MNEVQTGETQPEDRQYPRPQANEVQTGEVQTQEVHTGEVDAVGRARVRPLNEDDEQLDDGPGDDAPFHDEHLAELAANGTIKGTSKSTSDAAVNGAAAQIINNVLSLGDEKCQNEPNTEVTAGEMGGVQQELLKDRIVEQLCTIYDPEIPVNIYELGLIYSLVVDAAGNVAIDMTLTSPACPVAGTLPPEVEQKVREVEGVRDVKLELVWDPPYGMEMMSEAARLQLGLF